MKTFHKLILMIFVIFIFIALNCIIRLPSTFNKSDPKTTNEKDGVAHMVDILNHQSHWDSSELYRITPSIFVADGRDLQQSRDVTLVTQTSVQNLHRLINLAAIWKGGISVSVFSSPTEVLYVLTVIAGLRQCYVDIAQYVTFHVVTFEGNGNIKYSHIPPHDCVSLVLSDRVRNFDLSIPYPVNLLRNVAKSVVRTEFFFLIDIDMSPSPLLRQHFLDLVENKNEERTVYIVPAFELEDPIPAPSTKHDLKGLKEKDLLRPFYAEMCPKCQACVDYSSWFDLPLKGESHLSVAYNTDWTDPCEPFYISKRDVPNYDESFRQYGFNRISQVCELYIAGYKFSVLDNAFLVHFGMKTKDKFHKSKEEEQELNRKRFREFKQKLRYKYPESPRRC